MVFNNKMRKEAISKMERAKDQYEDAQKELVNASEILYSSRLHLKKIIDKSWGYINTIKNTPENIQVELGKIKITKDRYDKMLEKLEADAHDFSVKNTSGAAAGMAAGIGVVSFGPSALLGIATTFGHTATTGAAISGLYGAAQSSAALAWLGGGALTAGGAGVAGGSALLSLAGPIGWIIGGTALVGSGLMASGKNKKIAAQADEARVEIKAAKKVIKGHIHEVTTINSDTNTMIGSLGAEIDFVRPFGNDYKQMNDNQKMRLFGLVNNVRSAQKLMELTVGSTNNFK